MPAKRYERVTVTMQDGTLRCEPDWVHLYWGGGPEEIRWVFDRVPREAVGAVVEFLDAVPAKYGAGPARQGTFHPRGVHRGLGHAGASAGSHLPDVVTSGNVQAHGHFYYDVKLLDAAGNVLAQVDPGGDNQATPPP